MPRHDKTHRREADARAAGHPASAHNADDTAPADAAAPDDDTSSICGVQTDRATRSKRGRSLPSAAARSAARGSPKQVPVDEPALDPEKQFFVPIREDVGDVKKITGHALIRGPPASGKTTLAHAVRRKSPWRHNTAALPDAPRERSFVLLCAIDLNATINRAEQEQNACLVSHKIHHLLNTDDNLHGALGPSPLSDIDDVIRFLVTHNVAVLVDEAHVILRLGKSNTLMDIFSAFTKTAGLTAVFFTTTEVAAAGNDLVHSPPGIKKFFFRGLLPDVVVKGALRGALEGAEVYFTDEAAALLWELSGCHRGVFVHLVEWARSTVPGTRPHPSNVKTLLEAIREHRTNFIERLHASRAVKVNGDAVPGYEFLHCLALANFDASTGDVRADIIVSAITRGFIQPVRGMEAGSDRFMWYEDLKQESYRVGHVFQTDRYAALIADCQVKMEPLPYLSCADVVLDVLPQLRLLNMLTAKLDKSRPFLHGSDSCMPHEDAWNEEIRRIFNGTGPFIRGATTQHSTADNVGKPDFTWVDNSTSSRVTYIIESVMWDSGVAKHYKRFRPVLGTGDKSGVQHQTSGAGAAGSEVGGMENYQPQSTGDTHRALLVIGPDEETVRKGMNTAAPKGSEIPNVAVLGVFPFPGYTAMGFLAAPDAPVAHVPCDKVPRRWCNKPAASDGAVVVGRKVTSWGVAQNPDEVIVQERGGDAFSIQGLSQQPRRANNINRLKEAIRKELKQQGRTVVGKIIRVFDSAVAQTPLPIAAAVTVHTDLAPYVFDVEEDSCYASVELPDTDKPVPVDVAAKLRKGDLPRTVYGLIRAVLEELALEKSKGAQHVTVYPPAEQRGNEAYGTGAECGDVSTRVQGAPLTKPYHVVIK